MIQVLFSLAFGLVPLPVLSLFVGAFPFFLSFFYAAIAFDAAHFGES